MISDKTISGERRICRKMGITTKVREELSEESFFKIVQILIGTFAVELLLAAVLFLIGAGITWHFFFASFAIAIVAVNIINEQRRQKRC